jgi:hypothetical protein
MSRSGERRERRRQQNLAKLLRDNPAKFVRVWNLYLAGWTEQIVRKARDEQRHQEQPTPADEADADSTEPAAVKDSPAEYAAASFLATAHRWLGILGPCAEKLVGTATHQLLVHECCKLIAAETDKRLFDLVESRLYALIKRGALKSRHGEGQRRAARERKRTDQAFATPFNAGPLTSKRPALRKDISGDRQPAGPLPPVGLPGPDFNAPQKSTNPPPRVLVLDMHHDRAALLKAWFRLRGVEVVWGGLNAVTEKGVKQWPLRLIMIDPSILLSATPDQADADLRAFATAVSASSVNNNTQIILWAVDDAEGAAIAAPLKAAGIQVFRESFKYWNAPHAAGWLAETRRQDCK